MRWRLLALGVVLQSSVGCGPTAQSASTVTPAHSATHAIVGGEVAYDEATVFALGKMGLGIWCSATLIAPRTLLTAAHCVVDAPTGLAVTNHYNVTSWADALPVAEVYPHPEYADAGLLESDIALLQLTRAPAGVTPASINRLSVDTLTGQSVVAVGYGQVAAGDQPGTRRLVEAAVSAVTPSAFTFGSQGEGLCYGDSGGPSFEVGTGGRLLGVHTELTASGCGAGRDVRVDRFASFIDAFVTAHQATCASGNGCVDGCAPVDADCACESDGVCAADCAMPDEDPDCPEHCLADGVCAALGCAQPDADCLAEGADCATAEVCPGHQCLSDEMHPTPYCSRNCVNDGNCKDGMRCSFGVCRYPVFAEAQLGQSCQVGQTPCRGGVCAGPVKGEETCRAACSTSKACLDGSACRSSRDGVWYCEGPSVDVPMGGGTSHGCTHAPGGVAAVLLGLLLTRRRWRKCAQYSVLGSSPR